MRPNILFIMTDDQAPWTLGAEGHPNTHTPVLDRLTGEGALLRNMFANAAVCSPARAALITGRYPTEAGFGPDGRVFIADSERHLDPSLPTWPQVLRDNGYRTALIGKWHLGHEREECLPAQGGYEKFSGYPIGGKRSKDPRIQIEGEWREFKGQYTSDVLADLTMETIREWRDEPFAISLHFWAPHANQELPAGFVLSYDDRTWLPLKDEDLAPWAKRQLAIPNREFPNLDIDRVDRMMREYYASVHSVDRNVGRVLALLDELGLAGNTVVIFTSDQGYNLGHNGIWHKGNAWWITRDQRDPEGIYPGRDRPNLYEHSIRVPCVIRWPGRIGPGAHVSQPGSFLDWFPTLLEVTEVASPPETGGRGRSILPIMEGETSGPWDCDIFAQHDRLRCCRTPEWKLVRNFLPDQPDELYDLRSDPEEHHNRIGGIDDPEVRGIHERLDSKLQEWMHDIRDPLVHRGNDRGAEDPTA